MSTVYTQDKTSTVILALRLGWALSEFMGQARQVWEKRQQEGTQKIDKVFQGFAEDEAPRFNFSNRYFSEAGGWWQAALQIVSLAQKLNLFEKDDIADTIQTLPDQIYAFIFEPDKANLNKRSPRDFYNLLESWSCKAGVKLAVRSDRAALAFKVGGQLADTYWFMRDQEGFGQPRTDKQDSWHQLLNHKRLVTVIEDMKRFDEELPPLVGECLRFSLYHWMIAHDLDYQDGKLTLVRNESKKNPNLERENSRILKKLEANDEKNIKQRLSKQAKIWYDLIFGWRSPESYLNKQERRIVFWQVVGLYALRVLGAAIGLGVTGYLLIWGLGSWLFFIFNWLSTTFNWLLPTNLQPETPDKTVEIVAKSLPFITSAVVFVVSLLRDSWLGMRGLWAKIYFGQRNQKIKESTFVSWQGRGKSEAGEANG